MNYIILSENIIINDSKDSKLLSAAGMMLSSHSPPIATPLEPCRVAPYVNVPSLRLPTAYDRLPFPAFSAFDPALLTAAHQVRHIIVNCFQSTMWQGKTSYLSNTASVRAQATKCVKVHAFCHISPSCPTNDRYRGMRRLTTGIRSEKCVFGRFRRCANVIECTYTNLDSIAYYTPRL